MSQLLQQKSGITLQEFAIQHGLALVQAQRLAKEGRIMGAQKSRNGRWIVFSPSKLSEPIRPYTNWRDRGQS